MTPILSAVLALQSILGISTIEGTVVGPDQAPIAHAQVFLEPGLGGLLLDTVSSESGHFSFSDVPPGAAGVFAVAPGFGFSGQHINIAVADVVPPLRIALSPATTVQGTLVDPKGKPIDGARVTRFAVKGTYKVGIPLAKLRQFGYAEPASGADGTFTLDSVPVGTKIDLKIGHPNFAQEGVVDLVAGAPNVSITMHPGVLVEGDVVSRASQIAVAQAAVLIQNAQPPFDTSTASTNLTGKFSMRLKPGVYVYRAQGAGMRSGGMERLTITGERPVEHIRLTVAGIGTIRGNVRDAISGEPLREVRISLTTNGVEADITRTGPGGDFLFSAGEGENLIQLGSVSGYFPPDTQHMKVTLVDGADLELPGMWLKPLPAYQVRVVDGDQQPVPGALVTLLRPRQLGWHVADAQGVATLHFQNFPESGALLGRVEHPTTSAVALFTLEKTQDTPGTVQLFDAATVAGRVVNSRGRTAGGVSVGAFFPGETTADPVLLWQTFTDKSGAFQWSASVPGVPQRCAARAGDDGTGESPTFNLAPGEVKDLGEITVEGAKDSASAPDSPLRWFEWKVLCGALPPREVCENAPALLIYVEASNIPVLMESLARVKDSLAMPELVVALVAESAPDCAGGALPVLSGKAPGGATTLLVDRQGQIVLETSGLPPVSAIRKLP